MLGGLAPPKWDRANQKQCVVTGDGAVGKVH